MTDGFKILSVRFWRQLRKMWPICLQVKHFTERWPLASLCVEAFCLSHSSKEFSFFAKPAIIDISCKSCESSLAAGRLPMQLILTVEEGEEWLVIARYRCTKSTIWSTFGIGLCSSKLYFNIEGNPSYIVVPPTQSWHFVGGLDQFI